MNKTTLESLSDELFLDLFELFNAIDLFRALHDLNTRFNSLLFIYFRNYHVDLRSILKKDFDIFCQTYLSSILNRTIYLRISDDEDTPYQCTHFLSAGFTLGQFYNLRSLTFYHAYWCSYKFLDFFEKTPHLKNFSTSLSTYEEDDLPLFREFIPSSQNLSIKKLVITEVRSQRLMTNLFQLLPHVAHLKVEILSLNIDGHQWKQMIINYLPKLNVLQFMISLELGRSINKQTDEEKIDQFLETYRTPFWIEYHQWFIRCHWRRWIKSIWIRVYSLPYAFDCFPIFFDELDSKTKSTCSREMHFSGMLSFTLNLVPRMHP
ncbi:unnamed protein product [Rotaria sp. Silwood2]|nr:unnamed protein product [Rotaria sp. Silwood2]CAF3376209.1 unnamed protein product [Rotaria sp. Silwood2]